MITLKSPREIEQMKTSGRILASIHEQLREKIVPGITTNQINVFVHQQIEAAQPRKSGLKGMNLRRVSVSMKRFVMVSLQNMF